MDVRDNTTQWLGDADIAATASLLAEPARARVLLALADGRALPASRLAAEAGLSAQATSSHLGKLLDGRLVDVQRSGRHRFYRIADPRVATVLESLAAVAPAQPVRSLRQGSRAAALRSARTCYDHLAGRLGVAVTGALLEHGGLVRVDGERDTGARSGDSISKPLPSHPYQLGPASGEVFGGLGVDLEPLLAAGRSARPLLRFCLDWSEQRHHLAGRLGAALLAALCEDGWITRRTGRRDVTLTEAGTVALRGRLGVELSAR